MSTLWERRDCVSAQVEDSLVLLDLDTLVYHALNPTAAAIWELLAEPKAEAAVVQALCEQYEVSPEDCTHSVRRLMEQLAASKLVAPQAA